MQLARRFVNLRGSVPSRHRTHPQYRLLTRAMATKIAPEAKSVLDYWLGEGWEDAPASDVRPERMSIWFGGGPAIDAEIISKFGSACEALNKGDLDAWYEGGNVLETLAGIIIGDQFCRNAYRGTAKMYAADSKILTWANSIVVRIESFKIINSYEKSRFKNLTYVTSTLLYFVLT